MLLKTGVISASNLETCPFLFFGMFQLYDDNDRVTMRLSRLYLERMKIGSKGDSLFVAAGEPSGDRAAARVVERLSAQRSVCAFGIGGDRLAEAGVDLVAHIRRLTAFGPSQGASRLVSWAAAWAAAREAVKLKKPAVALLVDSPEVNLPLARALTSSGIRVVYYIGPQVWAWRPGRLALLKSRTSAVALILPFEKPIYDAAGVRAKFVGHPIMDEDKPLDPKEVRNRLGVAAGQRLVALLPGSRDAEVSNLSGPMIEAASRISNKGVRTVFAPAPEVAKTVESERAGLAGCAVPGAALRARDLLGAADAALVASGTATLEAAVAGTPMAVVYRIDRLSWIAARLLVKAPYIGLPNWISGKKIVPEILQDEANGENLAAHALNLLEPKERDRQKCELLCVAQSLGGPGAAGRVAELVSELMK